MDGFIVFIQGIKLYGYSVMMAIRIALFFSIFSSVSFAQTTYFVDERSGSDNWTGTLPVATEIDGPWKSLKRVNNARINPGDSILLKCGSVWNEELIIGGTRMSASQPTTVSSYGDGCKDSNKPVIDVAQTINDWELVDSHYHIYASTISAEINQIFVDGKYLNQSRFPLEGDKLITSPTGTSDGCVKCLYASTSLYAGFSLTKDKIEGGYVRVRINPYIIDEFVVDSYDPLSGKVQLKVPVWYEAESSGSPISAGMEYYYTNKPWMLELTPGWAYQNGRIYVRLPDNADPAAHIIEASKLNSVGLELNVSNLEVSGISIIHAGGTAVKLLDPGRFHLANLYVANSGHTGISVDGHNVNTKLNYGKIENNIISDSARIGVFLKNQTNTTISKNLITNTGTFGWPIRSYGAIWSLVSDGNRVSENKIQNSGYIGIRVQGQENVESQNASIEGNDIEGTCQVLDDCGAIYIQGFGGVRTLHLPKQDSLINKNTISNICGPPRMNPALPIIAAGIYLDDYTNHVVVSENTIICAFQGIFLHNAFNNQIMNNTLFKNIKNELLITETGDYPVSPKGIVKGNAVYKNIIVNSITSAPITEQSSFNTGGFAAFFANHYINLYSNDLENKNAKAFAYGQISGISYNDGSEVLSSWRPSIESQIAGRILSGKVKLQSGVMYSIEFKLRSEKPNQIARIALRQDSFPYETLGLDRQIIGDVNSKKVVIAFKSTSNSVGRVEFEAHPSQALHIDDLSIRMVGEQRQTRTQESAEILVNKTSELKIFDCLEGVPFRCGEYTDIFGSKINWPKALVPNTSLVAIKNIMTPVQK